MTDTSPKRLRGLADWLLANGWTPAAEKEDPGPVCPTCGSDRNERDELEKAEREIERLRGLLAENEAQHPDQPLEMVKPADVPLPDGAFLYHGELVNFDDHQLNRELRGVLRAAKEAHKPYMHEDELPASISDAEYAEWFKKSWILFGVRVGPVFPAGPAEVPLPTPCAWRTADYALLGDKVSVVETSMYGENSMHQYGQACAKAARDAAFDECAHICEKVSDQLGDGTRLETAAEGGAYQCVIAIKAAKKGTT